MLDIFHAFVIVCLLCLYPNGIWWIAVTSLGNCACEKYHNFMRWTILCSVLCSHRLLYCCTLNICLLLMTFSSSAWQFEPRSIPTKRRAWSGSQPFGTLMVFLKEMSLKWFKKKTSPGDKASKMSQLAKNFKDAISIAVVQNWFTRYRHLAKTIHNIPMPSVLFLFLTKIINI